MAYDEITVKKNNADGSVGESTASINNSEMGFETSSTPSPALDDYYTIEQTDTLFPKKDAVSSMTLLGSSTVSYDAHSNYIMINFSVDITKITQKTILILTYANCFTMIMVGQTGEGRVAGLLNYDNSGNARIAHVKAQVGIDNVAITSDAPYQFSGSVPTAYLFAFTVI